MDAGEGTEPVQVFLSVRRIRVGRGLWAALMREGDPSDKRVWKQGVGGGD